MRALRWLAALPGALICGYAAYLVGGALNNFTAAWFAGGPLTGWKKIAADVMAHIYMGAVFLYAAVKIAPAAPRYVAGGAFATLVALAILSIWSSVAIAKYYAIPAIAGLLFGGAAVLIGALAGEVRPYSKEESQRDA